METFSDAVEQLTSAQAGGFDFRAPQAEKLTQEGIDRLAGKSKWIRAQMQLGPIVAGQAAYSLPAKIVRLYDVAVNDIEYGRRDLKALRHLRSGAASLPYGSSGGVYVEAYAEDGLTRTVELWPPPEEEDTGLELETFSAILPDPLSGTDLLPFPADYRRAILNYAKSIASSDIDVDKATADSWLTDAENEAAALALLANARAGSGPWRIPVAGHRRR